MNKISTFLLVIGLAFYACTSHSSLTQITGEGIGTYYKITIADKTDITHFQIDSIISELNNSASIFNPNSLVARINRNETDTLNQTLKELLEVSLQVCEETEGFFDFTVGALVNFWGFGKDNLKETSQDDVEKELKSVGYKQIIIEGNRIIKPNPDTQLNFNAVAKGYCVDLISAFLSSKGLKNFLIDIGGELCVKGKREPNKKWHVGIQIPTQNKDGEIATDEIMEIEDLSVATSGNYRNYIEENGKRIPHIINPHTGYPEENDLLSVTVFYPNCAIADAYATALMVMGVEKAKIFIAKHPEIKAFLRIKN
ncbi:MAG: FAD:protein FMN transferase [Bacteroidales bacterium]|nr:FAD:protein FMN transferase [Bacteroidales bacterium]